MKILMTTDTIGGVWTYSLELSRALAAHGVEVALATMGPAPSHEQRREAAEAGNVSLYESDFKLEWMEDPWRDVDESGRWLLQLARVLEPDVVHINGYSHADLLWPQPVVVVGHSCVLSWWRAVRREAAPDSWNTYRKRVRSGLLAADMVVAPSMWMMYELQRFYGPLYSTKVIHNARAASAFSAAPKEKMIFSAGRLWDEGKNVAAVANASAQTDWPIYIAGEDRPPAVSAEAQARVNWLGRLSAGQMASWLSRAAVCALPARYEPFGLVALEAALSGCALILGNIQSLHEVWGDAAVYVSPDSSEELDDAIRALTADKGLRIEMAVRANRRAERYAVTRMAQEYMAVYQRLLAARGRTPADAGHAGWERDLRGWRKYGSGGARQTFETK